MNEEAMKIWTDKWPAEIHESERSIKRIDSARSAKLTPIRIDYDDCFGYFQGAHGRYETFLDYCPCGDSRKGKYLCKHIYRLAIELGVLDFEADTNPDAIVAVRSDIEAFSIVCDRIEKLSPDAQNLLLRIIINTSATNPSTQTPQSDALSELVSAGFVYISTEESPILKFGRKAELIELLETEGIEVPKGAKVADLQLLCKERAFGATAKRFGADVFVCLCKTCPRKKTHYYLHRKLGYCILTDQNGEFITVPMLETELPRDDVTHELVMRGYYEPK